jgi:hypothetical protein
MPEMRHEPGRDSQTPPGRALPLAARDPAIRDLTARLVAAVAPERILLFGSHAWGTPDADNDLNVIVPDGALIIVPARRDRSAQRTLREGRDP